MITLSFLKWEFLFLSFMLTAIFGINGRRFDHIRRDESKREENEDVQDDDELYFNGADRTGKNDDKLKITAKDLPRDGELFEGDMIMDSRLRRAVLGEEEKKSASILSVEGKERHWEDATVPYEIHDSLKPELRVRIPQAIRIFNYYTCIKYIPREPHHVDYVVIRNGKGCSSSVGKVGGKQTIHLAEGCSRIGTVMHEMMHVLGIIHEQSRDDRDEYLKVNFDNIKKKLFRNFQKYDYSRSSDMNIPYNYYSVMHYSNYAFSKNDEPTLQSKYDPELKFGQRKFLSHLDVKEINRLYGCTGVRYDPRRLHTDMTAKMCIERRRDNLRDILNKWDSEDPSEH